MKKILFSLVLLLLAFPCSATLYNYYAEQGLKLPSIRDRAVLAQSYGIANYQGTAGQNKALEAYLRGSVVLGGATSSAPTPTPLLNGANTWTATNTFSGAVNISGTTTLATTTISNLTIGATSTATLVGNSSTTLHFHFPLAVETAISSSANLLNSNDSESGGTSETNYTLQKETISILSGYYNIYFEVKGNLNGPGYGKIYKNGIAAGTERSSTLYAAYTETIWFAPGDLIQIYAKGDGDSTAYIQNLRLYGTLLTTTSLGYNSL